MRISFLYCGLLAVTVVAGCKKKDGDGKAWDFYLIKHATAVSSAPSTTYHDSVSYDFDYYESGQLKSIITKGKTATTSVSYQYVGNLVIRIFPTGTDSITLNKAGYPVHPALLYDKNNMLTGYIESAVVKDMGAIVGYSQDTTFYYYDSGDLTQLIKHRDPKYYATSPQTYDLTYDAQYPFQQGDFFYFNAFRGGIGYRASNIPLKTTHLAQSYNTGIGSYKTGYAIVYSFDTFGRIVQATSTPYNSSGYLHTVFTYSYDR